MGISPYTMFFPILLIAMIGGLGLIIFIAIIIFIYNRFFVSWSNRVHKTNFKIIPGTSIFKILIGVCFISVVIFHSCLLAAIDFDYFNKETSSDNYHLRTPLEIPKIQKFQISYAPGEEKGYLIKHKDEKGAFAFDIAEFIFAITKCKIDQKPCRVGFNAIIKYQLVGSKLIGQDIDKNWFIYDLEKDKVNFYILSEFESEIKKLGVNDLKNILSISKNHYKWNDSHW